MLSSGVAVTTRIPLMEATDPRGGGCSVPAVASLAQVLPGGLFSFSLACLPWVLEPICAWCRVVAPSGGKSKNCSLLLGSACHQQEAGASFWQLKVTSHLFTVPL